MRTDRLTGVVLWLALAGLPMRAAAQDPLTGVGGGTEVASIDFRYEDTETFSPYVLVPVLGLTERGSFVGLRRFFDFLPFILPVGTHPFDPLELQRDVIRLTRFYQREGFLRAGVDYEVEYDGEEDLVEVTYVITEGPQVAISDVRYVLEGDSALVVPEDLRQAWRRYHERVIRENPRWSESRADSLAGDAVRWLRDRGWPFAAATPTSVVDSVAYTTRLTITVTPGPRARVRSLVSTGQQSMPADHVTREFAVKPGEWYSGREVEKGRARLAQMDVVQLALVDVPRDSLRDSTVVVLTEITENPGHLITGNAGFSSDGGLTAEGKWVDRSFLGGLRTLTVDLTAQSGLLALEDPPTIRYRLGLTAFQPYLFDPRLSLAGGPSIEYRNDVRDESWVAAVDGALAWVEGPLRSVSLGYSLSRREILEARGTGFPEGAVDYPPLLGFGSIEGIDSITSVVHRGVLSLNATYGHLDNLTNPRKGFVVRPRAEVSAPDFVNNSEYALLDLAGSFFLPITRTTGVSLRGGIGKILPFGGSIPDPGSSPYVALQRLRDVLFATGGTRDVRGWGSQLLGPKVPDVQEDDDGDIVVERYAPTGGLARFWGSLELRMPLPAFPEQFETFTFLDAGRVWTADERFGMVDDIYDQERVFLGTGLGMSFQTIAGAIQLAVGYKLNPSALDLRDAEEVYEAMEAGVDIETVPEDSRRRFQLHFAIGTTF